MWKVNDIIICKKSMKFKPEQFIIGQKYTIHKIHPHSVTVNEIDINNKTINSFTFLTILSLDMYFYTIEEYRKMKLKKLNEIR